MHWLIFAESRKKQEADGNIDSRKQLRTNGFINRTFFPGVATVISSKVNVFTLPPSMVCVGSAFKRSANACARLSASAGSSRNGSVGTDGRSLYVARMAPSGQYPQTSFCFKVAARSTLFALCHTAQSHTVMVQRAHGHHCHGSSYL